jgi:hypothetical protein
MGKNRTAGERLTHGTLVPLMDCSVVMWGSRVFDGLIRFPLSLLHRDSLDDPVTDLSTSLGRYPYVESVSRRSS